jgi:beta-glucosidase-like glycosyl hydrolase
MHKAWCNTSKTIDDRVDALVAEIELSEIPALLTAREGGGGSPGPSGAIKRLGLPEYDWGVNCIHGVQTTCINNTRGDLVCPTSFPNPNALGAGFNSSMWREMGKIIGYELRALWINGATEASSWSGQPHAGLDCWSPNINIARDPRWGRNQEVPSEDPYVNGVFGMQYTRGLQRNDAIDAARVQAIVTMKHWDAYTLEDSDGFTRHDFDAKVDNYTLADTFLPAWRASIVDGGAKVSCRLCTVTFHANLAHSLTRSP